MWALGHSDGGQVGAQEGGPIGLPVEVNRRLRERSPRRCTAPVECSASAGIRGPQGNTLVCLEPPGAQAKRQDAAEAPPNQTNKQWGNLKSGCLEDFDKYSGRLVAPAMSHVALQHRRCLRATNQDALVHLRLAVALQSLVPLNLVEALVLRAAPMVEEHSIRVAGGPWGCPPSHLFRALSAQKTVFEAFVR